MCISERMRKRWGCRKSFVSTNLPLREKYFPSIIRKYDGRYFFFFYPYKKGRQIIWMWCMEFMSYTYNFNRGSRRRRVISRLAGNIRGNGSLYVVCVYVYSLYDEVYNVCIIVNWGCFEIHIHVSEISGFHYIDVINWATYGSIYRYVDLWLPM